MTSVLDGVYPPPHTPRVLLETAEEVDLATDKLPNSVALPFVAICIKSIKVLGDVSGEGDLSAPPAHIPLVEFEQAPILYLPIDKSPKSCASPVVEIVTKVIVLSFAGSYPPPIIPRVGLANAPPASPFAIKSPKSFTPPVVDMVIKSNVPVEPGEVCPDFDIPLVEFANPILSAVPVVVRLSPHAVVVHVDEKVTKSIVDLLDGVLPAAIKPLVREPNPLHLLLPSDISDPKSIVLP